MRSIILLFILECLPLLLFAKSKRDPLQEFTLLAIVSSVIVVGLWLLLWLKKRKNNR